MKEEVKNLCSCECEACVDGNCEKCNCKCCDCEGCECKNKFEPGYDSKESKKSLGA
jgi:hypothetical protein